MSKFNSKDFSIIYEEKEGEEGEEKLVSLKSGDTTSKPVIFNDTNLKNTAEKLLNSYKINDISTVTDEPTVEPTVEPTGVPSGNNIGGYKKKSKKKTQKKKTTKEIKKRRQKKKTLRK